MNLQDYIGYSGDAQGSDQFWREESKKRDIGDWKDYLVSDMDHLTSNERGEVEHAYWEATEDLGRILTSSESYVGKLVRRDYLQAKAGESIYAIGIIVKPGDKSKKGKAVRSKYESVDGGTGYCVQMAIHLNKPVFVFDQNRKQWYEWSYLNKRFITIDTPILTKKYTGVGTREINDDGRQAIINVLEKQ